MSKPSLNKILLIQTAFIGDVILATAMIEKIKAHYPECQLDFLVRKGNEALVANNPKLNEVLIWEKNEGKYKSLYRILKTIRSNKYDAVINTQRFGATGLLTAYSGAPIRSGFKKNPFSFRFTHKANHEIGNGTHEVERNQKLIEFLTDSTAGRPKLYPSTSDYEKVKLYKEIPYITLSPTSVWFTKQFPAEKWVDLIEQLPSKYNVFLLGGPGDKKACQDIIDQCKTNVPENLAGKLSLLQSAALMEGAHMNYVNDSGPLHLCSSMNAPVTSVFCSTIPGFGFTPLSDKRFVVETTEDLECRPCGLHGHKACPKGHFNCAKSITSNQLLQPLDSI